MNLSRLIACLFSILLMTQGAYGQQETASVQGRVCSLSGDPCKGAIVKFYELEWVGGVIASEKLRQQVSTDEEGNYKITDLAPATYRVEATLQGFAKAEVLRVYLWKGADRILDIGLRIAVTHLLKRTTVNGSVRQQNHSPIVGATVTIVNAFNLSLVQQARTDSTGAFKFDSFEPGQYVLYATKPGFLINSTTVNLGNGSNERAELILKNEQPRYVKER